MVVTSKEDVLHWYKDLNAPNRLEIVCALLDHSLPFELRFLGSVIENLGRKDFQVLRDAECRANSLHSVESALEQEEILKLLSEGPALVPITLNPQFPPGAQTSTSVTSLNSQISNATDSSSARPTLPHSQDQRVLDGSRSQSESSAVPNGNGLPAKSNIHWSIREHLISDKSNSVNTASPAASTVEKNSDEEGEESKKDVWLQEKSQRRKLILYLSLLTATNHDSANLYYNLMADVEKLMENLEWLEDCNQADQDEIFLLYTIGTNHPAFNFEQRTFLYAVLNRFKDYLEASAKSRQPPFDSSPSPPNAILTPQYLTPHHFGGKNGAYYYFAPQPVQNIQCSQPSNAQNVGGGHTLDGIRAPPFPYASYQFPVFMAPPHPHHPHMAGQQQFAGQQQDQRNHSIAHSSLRQKPLSSMPNQNTAKRRPKNSSIASNSSTTTGGSSIGNISIPTSQSQISKSDEDPHQAKDRWSSNNVLVVSANPTKNVSDRSDRGKIYHHPNSVFSNGPPPVGDRATSSMINFSSGSMLANSSSGQVVTNTHPKPEETLLNEVSGSMPDYAVVSGAQMPTYHSSGPIYGHPNAAFISVQNGFLPPSFYQSVRSTTGINGPPSTEILMNPSHVQPPYPFTFPFTTPTHFQNQTLPTSKSMGANNIIAKDSLKLSLPLMNPTGSSTNEPIKQNSSPRKDSFARSCPPPSSQPGTPSAGIGLSSPSTLIQMPSQSPMSMYSSRPRGVILEIGGQTNVGGDFPSMTSLENALMPPLEEPIEINTRPRKISCYNCGSNAHLGPECKEASMEEMTRKQYRLNYGGSSTDSKEGE